jgi:hypothetical protein
VRTILKAPGATNRKRVVGALATQNPRAESLKSERRPKAEVRRRESFEVNSILPNEPIARNAAPRYDFNAPSRSELPNEPIPPFSLTPTLSRPTGEGEELRASRQAQSNPSSDASGSLAHPMGEGQGEGCAEKLPNEPMV